METKTKLENRDVLHQTNSKTQLHKSHCVPFSKHHLPKTLRNSLQIFKLRTLSFFSNFLPRSTGSILGKPVDEFKKLYKLDKKNKKNFLGSGGFGKTYICEELSTKTRYACKTIPKKKLKTEQLKESVKAEIRILELFTGVPNIVQIKDAYEDRKSVHIVMELCDGGELYDKIKAVKESRGYYSEKVAAEIFKSIMEAIQVIHSSDVIHRDVKPENFLFSGDDEDKTMLKAIDFGCSVQIQKGRELTDKVVSEIYVAPEVLNEESHGKEVDIWSAGVILYILLCGQEPFANVHETKGKKLDLHSTPWPSISPNAKNLVKKMLKRDPKKRISAEEVLEHCWIKNEAPDMPLDDIVFTRLKQFQTMNKIKKLALKCLAETLSEEEIKDLKTVFEKMDTDNSGSITYEELKNGLHKLGSKISENEVKQLMQAADVDGNGTIEYNEFITATIQKHGLVREESLRKAFQRLDKDGSQYITKDELETALKEHCMEDEACLEKLISEVDTDNDGKIDYAEFCAMIGNVHLQPQRKLLGNHHSS